MNKIIKFRAWDNNKKVIRYLGDMYCGTYGSMLDNFEDEDIMQFTGLKDKNGKEIYEGDIVKGNLPSYIKRNYKDHCIEEVKWNEEGYWEPFNKIIDFDGVKWTDEYMDIEVIGNIYQNPELLK